MGKLIRMILRGLHTDKSMPIQVLHLGKRFVALRTGDSMRKDPALRAHYGEFNEDRNRGPRYSRPSTFAGLTICGLVNKAPVIVKFRITFEVYKSIRSVYCFLNL